MTRALSERTSDELSLRDVASPSLPGLGVVLAAGRSERLSKVTRGRSKALVRLGGLTLVERAVRTLLDSGVGRVLVVVGHESEAMAGAVSRLLPEQVEVARAERWEEGNGESLAAAEPFLAGAERFVLLCVDHVFAPGALDGLLDSDEPAVLVDDAPRREVWEEGTRVRIAEGQALEFGKHLPEPGVDCGAFVLGPEIFACQRAAAGAGDHTLSGAVSRLGHLRPLRAEPLPAGGWWQDVDTPGDLRAARRLLRRSLTKNTDGPVSRYLNRPISTRISMALSPLRLPPDAISYSVFLLGIVAASSLAAGKAVLGGLLVHAASLLDGVDGETARLRLRAGARGAWLDGVLDRMVDAAIVAGLGLWALTKPFGGRSVLLLLGVALAWAAMAMSAKGKSDPYSLPAQTEHTLGFLLGGRDGRLLLVAVGSILGRPMLAVMAMSATWVFSVILRMIVVWRTSRGETALWAES